MSVRRAVCRVFAVVAGIAFAALALVVAGAAPATAHARLELTTPANEAVIDAVPGSVILRFDEAVSLDLGAGILVYAPNGERIDRGPSKVTNAGRTVTVSVDDGGRGTYAVAWRATSKDAHVLVGSFVFHVGERTGSNRPSQAPAVPSIAIWIGRWLGYTGFAVAAGLAWWSLGSVGRSSQTVRRIALVAAAAAVLGSVLRFVFQVADASGRSIGSSARLWGDAVLDTRAGLLDALRIAAALAVLGLAFFLPRRWSASLLLVCAGGAATAAALNGHAWTAADHVSTVAADIVHQGAAAVWLGGLIGLATEIRSGERSGGARFGRAAIRSVGVLIVTGSWAGYAQLGNVAALTGTAYGRLLIAKVAAVAVMGLLGWRNRARIADVGAVWVGHLRSGFRLEMVAAVAVVAVTSVLVGTVPPRGGSASGEPFYARLESPRMGVDLTVFPAKRGSNTLHLYFYNANGNPEGVDAAEVTVARPEFPARRVRLFSITADHFTADSFTLPARGAWTVAVTATRRGKPDQFTVEVPVT